MKIDTEVKYKITTNEGVAIQVSELELRELYGALKRLLEPNLVSGKEDLKLIKYWNVGEY